MKVAAVVLLVALCVTIGYSASGGEAGTQRPGKTLQRLTPAQAHFKQQILNGYCCLPNMSSGYSTVKVVNGHWKKKEGDLEQDATMSDPVFGLLTGKPVAVVPIVYWGGGTGYFGSILLYEQKNGRTQTVGSYPYGDRVDILSLTFKDGKVRLVTRGAEHGPFSDEREPETTWLRRSDFDVAECIGKELPKPLAEELRELEKYWGRGDQLTAAERRRAVEICNRHAKDRAYFANLVRLYLEECGWGPGPSPLRFDSAGNPSFYEEGELKVDLTATGGG